MSDTDPPPSSASRLPPRAEAPRASAGLSAPETEAPRCGNRHPCLDLDTMHGICARARRLVPGVPQACAQGYRLIAMRDRHISWVDLRLAGHAYAVLGSHARCDLVLADDASVWLRHVAVIVARLEDEALGVRLVDLKTDVPFFVESDTPQQSALARGQFAMRLGRHVICGFPVIFLDATRGGAANDGAVHAVPVVEPGHTGLPQLLSPKPPGQTRLTVARGAVGAAVEVPTEALDEGIILGRSLNCFDAGLRRVLSDGAISGAHVLLLRSGGEVFAYDLCSANGTRVAGQRVRRHRFTDAEPAVELGKGVILSITSLTD